MAWVGIGAEGFWAGGVGGGTMEEEPIGQK